MPELSPSGSSSLVIWHLADIREDATRRPDWQRPDWHTYFMDIAQRVADRADCTRSKVGAVIVDSEHRIISTGYNGAPAGEPGCLEGACPRGRHFGLYGDASFDLACNCGNPWPCEQAAEAGVGDYSDCISLHAELNAVIYAGRDKCAGSVIYITRAPCSWCTKVLQAAGISLAIIP